MSERNGYNKKCNAVLFLYYNIPLKRFGNVSRYGFFRSVIWWINDTKIVGTFLLISFITGLFIADLVWVAFRRDKIRCEQIYSAMQPELSVM